MISTKRKLDSPLFLFETSSYRNPKYNGVISVDYTRRERLSGRRWNGQLSMELSSLLVLSDYDQGTFCFSLSLTLLQSKLRRSIQNVQVVIVRISRMRENFISFSSRERMWTQFHFGQRSRNPQQVHWSL